MMLIAGAGGFNYAVVVTQVVTNGSGVPEIRYFDPTTGLSGKVLNGQYSGFYAVSH